MSASDLNLREYVTYFRRRLGNKGIIIKKNKVNVAHPWPPYKKTTCLRCLLPSIPTTASIYLLIIPLIWESFSSCCCRSLRSLSSSRFWYCRRILLVCCSCVRSLRSYSSSFLWDIIRRSFRELISSSYSRTWGRDRERIQNQSCSHWASFSKPWFLSGISGSSGRWS